MLGNGKAEVEWMKRRSVSGDGSFMVVNYTLLSIG
jgi:hypothetical protein